MNFFLNQQLFIHKDNSMSEKLKLGVVSLNEIKLRMQYDLSKTLTENLEEQITSYEMYLDRTFADPKKAQEFHDQNKKIIDWFSTLSTHDWLTLIEISTAILGMIPSPASPILLGISTLAGVSDAGVYYAEGDKYMGTMMLALSVIPGGELLKAVKGSKVLIKRGVGGYKSLIKKYKAGVKLTELEIKDLKILGKKIAENASEVNKLMTKNLTTKILESLTKRTPKFLINLILMLKKLGVIKLSEISLKIGGIVYGIDQLYLWVFRDLIPSRTDLDQRTRNELRASINGLLGNEQAIKEYLIITAADGINKLIKSGKSPRNIDVGESPDEFFKESSNRQIEKIKKEKKVGMQSVSPSFDSVLNNKSIIKKGQSGDSVKKIQKMLYELGYDYLLTAFETSSNWNDGIFGENTKDAVTAFQEDNSLKVDGIVSKDTLSKLNDIYQKDK
jgi:hypothetical protein